MVVQHAQILVANAKYLILTALHVRIIYFYLKIFALRRVNARIQHMQMKMYFHVNLAIKDAKNVQDHLGINANLA